MKARCVHKTKLRHLKTPGDGVNKTEHSKQKCEITCEILKKTLLAKYTILWQCMHMWQRCNHASNKQLSRCHSSFS